MAKTEPIDLYVARALDEGLDHAAIRAELAAAGWPTREVEDALAGWAERTDRAGPPVPRPRSGFSFLDLMLWVMLLVALSVSAFNLVTLTHGLLEYLLPDLLDGSAGGRGRTARWALATLIVAAPVYGALVRWIDRDIARNPHKRASGIRRAALGLMLSLAGIVLACDAVVTVFTLLNGELTLRFVLKALTVAVVAAGVLLIGRSDLDPASDGRIKRGILWAGAVATIALILWTFAATGTPSSVRDARLDRQRYEDLTRIGNALRCRTVTELPTTLSIGAVVAYCPDSAVAPSTLNDPLTNEPYGYTRIDAGRFRLCASFADRGNLLEFEPAGANWLLDVESGCIEGRNR